MLSVLVISPFRRIKLERDFEIFFSKKSQTVTSHFFPKKSNGYLKNLVTLKSFKF